jgi:hypothetical protein
MRLCLVLWISHEKKKCQMRILRREKEGLSRLSDEKAIKEAVVRGDAIRVPKGMSGTEFSKELSKMVEQARIHRGRKATSTAETSTDG